LSWGKYMILIQNCIQRKRNCEALKVLGALLRWVQLFLKQLLTVLIQFGETLSTFGTHWFQPALWVRSVSALSNVVALRVQRLGCCTGAAPTLDFNSCREKSSEQKRRPPKPVTVSDNLVLAVFPSERQKFWQ